ncbi:MAG TPA: hypothetical protein VIL18_02695 [Longimicrobiales bacterium]|jgi:hypothetical protein
MGWARRPARDTPQMAQRTFRDERGRTWVGSISSGTLQGGEEHAEVIFVCRDQPGELKRVARLDLAPAAADDAWRAMDEAELREIFGRSEPA